MKLVGYYRTSTDDKGQDHHRQRDVVENWAAKHGHQILAHVVDEGTSGAKDPFQRQYFLEAVEFAEQHSAEGIAVESVDRATRGGIEAFMTMKAALRIDHGLLLKVATTPAGLPPALEELYDSSMAAVARMFRERMREQIKSGIARARAKGFPNGRPGRAPKPQLTLAEIDLVRDLVINQGAGVDKCALEVSRARGAFDRSDPKSMMKTRVGPTWLWKQVRANDQLVDVRQRWAARQIVPKSRSPKSLDEPS